MLSYNLLKTEINRLILIQYEIIEYLKIFSD